MVVSDATIDIANALLTEVASVAELVARAEASWGVRADSIVFPGTSISGLTTRTDPLFADVARRPGEHLEDIVALCGAKEWRLWLNLDLDLKAVRSDLVHVKGFFGGSSSHACINAPATHRALERILRELAHVTGRAGEGVLTGVVFSIQELWPISGTDVLKLTCFCRSCRADFERLDPGLLAHFRLTPNPWDLVLRHTPLGIDHVDAITPRTTAAELVAMSRAGGFYAGWAANDASERHLLHWADLALRYAHARHQITVGGLTRITALIKQVFGPEARVAATVSEFPYDWLAGTFLEELERKPPVDEFWIDPGNADAGFESVPYRYYVWERSRYYVRSFFHALEASISEAQRSLSDRFAHELRRAAEEAGRALLSTATTAPLSLQLLPDPPPALCRGVVLAPLYRDVVDALVDLCTPGADGG